MLKNLFDRSVGVAGIFALLHREEFRDIAAARLHSEKRRCGFVFDAIDFCDCAASALITTIRARFCAVVAHKHHG